MGEVSGYTKHIINIKSLTYKNNCVTVVSSSNLNEDIEMKEHDFKVGDAVKVDTGGTFVDYGMVVRTTRLYADVKIQGIEGSVVQRFKKSEMNWD